MEFNFLLNNVTIELKEQLPQVDPILFEDSGLVANQKQFKIKVKDVGEFYAENGQSVYLKLSRPFEKNLIQLYLNGSVLGAILQQKSILALHGSSISYKGRGIVICGNSGFGKSTLAISLSNQLDAGLLTDDITPIIDHTVVPIGEQVKLTTKSADYFNIPPDDRVVIARDYDKFIVQNVSQKTESEISLIYIGTEGATLSFREIYGAEKVLAIVENQYWKELNSMDENQNTELFKQITELCNSAKVYIFSKPSDTSIDDAAQSLVNHIKERI